MVLTLTHFYSPEELFDIITSKLFNRLSLEYGPNLFVAIDNEHELKFACEMVAHDHASYISEEDYQQHVRDQDESAHTDKYEKDLTDARKARRIAHRIKKGGSQSCSLPHTETHLRDHTTSHNTSTTSAMSNQQASVCSNSSLASV